MIILLVRVMRKVAKNLQYLEEVITYEGPETIAAMFIETVTGTNGILPRLPDICRVYAPTHGDNILLVCDEVMCGFGRTGRCLPSNTVGLCPIF